MHESHAFLATPAQVFSRFHHSDWQEMRWDHGGILTDHDLWKWWTPEVKAAPVNPTRPLDAARL